MKKLLVLILLLMSSITLSNTALAESSETENPYRMHSSNGTVKNSEKDLNNFNGQGFDSFQGTGLIESDSKIKEAQDEIQKFINKSSNELINKESGELKPFKIKEPDYAVIGTDTRNNKVPDTRVFPYSAILAVAVYFPSDEGICTGTLISKNHVLTNVHCLYK
ncbi:trypsin-like serine protease [Bacillus cereus]|uniref:trypsin-like serine protease n=1 Tax=Bacillus cereus TaxID=1396 RepID=UPI00397FAF0E